MIKYYTQKSYIKSAAVAFFLNFFFNSAYAESVEKESFLELQTVILLLAESPAIFNNEQDKILVHTIRATTNFIQDRLKGTQGPLPTQYTATLAADNDLLREALGEPIASKRRELLQMAQSDLSLKRAYLQQSAGFSIVNPASTLVEVAITTKVSNTPKNGYTVQCNPRRYGDSPIFTNIFPNLSSPSKGKLAPGIYTCRFGTSSKIDISVGLTGAATESIEVEISN